MNKKESKNRVENGNRIVYYPCDSGDLRNEGCMKGNIYTNDKCPICKGKLIHDEKKYGLSGFQCVNNPEHINIKPKNCRVKFGRDVSKRFTDYHYNLAVKFLNSLRFKTDEGTYDARDYKKDNTLGFETQALKWLSIKKKTASSNHYRNLKRDIYKAIGSWDQKNIRIIGYGDIEDFLFDLPVGAKTRYNTWSCIHDFFTWASKREKIPMPDMPDCSNFELGWRTIIDLETQSEILDMIKKISWDVNPKIWIGIKWLATYVAIRPNELRNLKEKEISINGFFVIPDPKEKKPKLVGMLEEDIELYKSMPIGFPEQYFFRHEKGNGNAKPGSQFGKDYLYKWWKKACAELGIEGVDLYGGTRHSTANALAEHFTREELRESGTMHATNQAFERYVQTKKNDSKKIYQKVSEMRGEIINLKERKKA